MEKVISRIAVLALLLPVINQGARAAVAKNINLACDGTLKHLLVNGGAPERIKRLGIVVSLHKKTVSFAGHKVPITKVDAANIAFGGTESKGDIASAKRKTASRRPPQFRSGILIKRRKP